MPKKVVSRYIFQFITSRIDGTKDSGKCCIFGKKLCKGFGFQETEETVSRDRRDGINSGKSSIQTLLLTYFIEDRKLLRERIA